MEFWRCRSKGLGVFGGVRGILNLQGQVVVWISMDLKVRREILGGDKDLDFLSILMVIKTAIQKEILNK